MHRRDVLRVHANDLNPHSFAALRHNLQRNRRELRAPVLAYNLDGRDFVRALAAAREPVDHFILNLPNDALAFCDVFVGLHTRAEGEDQRPAVRALTPVPAVGGDNGGGGGGGGGNHLFAP